MVSQMILEEKQEASMKSSAATKYEATKLLSKIGGHSANIKYCNAGIEMMTPFPVPTHKRLQDTIRAVILTNENPSFPVPERSMQHSLIQKKNLQRSMKCLYLAPCFVNNNNNKKTALKTL
ncbi:hypothetical protein E2320_016084 [Naja naja]|nr:hypothetical protein E2320_016084 [Naja naja]